MSVRTVLGRLFRRGGPTVVVECRQCGTSVSPEATRCPECDAPEISRYEIPE